MTTEQMADAIVRGYRRAVLADHLAYGARMQARVRQHMKPPEDARVGWRDLVFRPPPRQGTGA